MVTIRLTQSEAAPMELPPGPTTAGRTITRPHSKLNRLCELAAARGGDLTTFAAVAKALELTPGRVTQMFGHGEEKLGKIIEPKTVGRLAAVFAHDGVRCEVDWLYVEFEDFASRLAKANPTSPAHRPSVYSDAPA